MTEKISNKKTPSGWVIIVGAVLGGLTLLFFMALVLLSVFDKQVPCESRFLIVLVLAFGAALASSFLGGSAAVRGKIPIPLAKNHPLEFSAAGGIAVLLLLIFIGKNAFIPNKCDDNGPYISCSEGYQSFYTKKLKLGFCYPRYGWEIDKASIEINAADIFVRKSDKRDVSVHLHISLIPANYFEKHKEYMKAVSNTWKQLDDNLEFKETYLSGKEAYEFSLNVKDRESRSRPTEVTSTFITKEKLLEVILTWFEDTLKNDINTMKKIKSTIVIQSR